MSRSVGCNRDVDIRTQMQYRRARSTRIMRTDKDIDRANGDGEQMSMI